MEGFGINAQRDQWQLGPLRDWQRLLKASFQAFVHACHRLLHHLQGRSGGADQRVPGLEWSGDQLLKALHHPMGAEGMGDACEGKAVRCTFGSQPAPVVQPWIGQMQTSAVGNQLRIQICLHLYLDARLKYWLQQGFQCRYAFPAAHEHSELVALLERGSQALGEAAAGHTASHYLMGAGVESIDGQQQAGQTRRGHA